MRSEQSLFAARDRFGIKPLFYAWHNNTLYIASEVKALFAAGVPARWDEESVYQSFTFGGHQMRTLYDGVHPGAAGTLPDRNGKACSDHALLGLQLSGRER